MYGFRVPLIVISKYAQPGVSHVTHDFGSILTFIEHNFGLSQMGDASGGTASTTWNADGLAAARGDYMLDMFNYRGNIGFTTVSQLEHFTPIDAPLPREWFLAAKPHIKYPGIDTDMDDEPLSNAERAEFEQVRRHHIYVLHTAIHEQQTGIKRLTLPRKLSSRMPTGTKFTAVDITGKTFAGHIISHPARHSSGSGTLQLNFDDSLTVIDYVDKRSRAAARLSREKPFDNELDRSMGANDNTYLGSTTATSLTLVSKGGEAELPKGQVIVVKVEKRNLR
jgi:hypothetical protein